LRTVIDTVAVGQRGRARDSIPVIPTSDSTVVIPTGDSIG